MCTRKYNVKNSDGGIGLLVLVVMVVVIEVVVVIVVLVVVQMSWQNVLVIVRMHYNTQHDTSKI